jgi:SAM-dependent methyltransferase
MTFHHDTRRPLRAGHDRVGDRWTRLPSRVWAPVGARLYDPFLSLAESRGMAARRARLLAEARGRVLEIGAGTGLNLEHYPTHVEEVVLTEPVAAMVRRLAGRAGASPLPTPITVARAERLPFPDDSFDTVVSTLVLCTVPDPTTALTELRRVLRPTGRLLFCEHVRSESPRLARWQTSLRGGWAVFAQGCRPDRRLLEMISDAFDVRSVVHDHWRGMPALVRPLVVGSAAPFPSEPARVSAERRSAHGGRGRERTES